MQNEFYDDLKNSLTEALGIAKGEIAPSRTFSYDSLDVKAIRGKTGLSQVQFANKLNISPRTLQNWEQGTRNPTGPAATLMRILDKNPHLLTA